MNLTQINKELQDEIDNLSQAAWSEEEAKLIENAIRKDGISFDKYVEVIKNAVNDYPELVKALKVLFGTLTIDERALEDAIATPTVVDAELTVIGNISLANKASDHKIRNALTHIELMVNKENVKDSIKKITKDRKKEEDFLKSEKEKAEKEKVAISGISGKL